MLANITKAITGFLAHNNNPLGFFLLGLSALIEYVFPPFPGDTVTLFGAFLITRYAWSLPWVFVSVMAGSGVGAMADFYFGRWLKGRYEQGRFIKREKTRQQIDRVLQNFRRWGEAYVAFNRFLPAVRAIFFVAAGMAGLRPLRVLFFALMSAAAWNALIIGAGYAVGANWDRLKALMSTYSTIAWILLVLVLAFFTGRWILKRRKASAGGDPATYDASGGEPPPDEHAPKT